MEVTKALLSKFFRQACTPEELAAVNEYFHNNPQELENYLDEKEWESFSVKDELDPTISQQMFDVIESHIDKKSQRVAMIRVISIAASLFVVLGVAIFIGLNKYRVDKISLTGLQTANKLYNDTIYNKSVGVRLITLTDGSQISLSPASAIVYIHAFNQKKRDIYLTGEAFFKVTKDKNRPFTVYAGGLSTTALGTSFRVTAFRESNLTRVQLYTGKVVVKELKNKDNVINADVYLTPGKMIALNRATYTTTVSDIKATLIPAADGFVSNSTIKGNTINFNNQPLKTVIEVLQKAYRIKINADNANLTNRFFTGTVNTQKDTAEDVLHTLAMLNKLNLSKQNGTYYLAE